VYVSVCVTAFLALFTVRRKFIMFVRSCGNRWRRVEEACGRVREMRHWMGQCGDIESRLRAAAVRGASSGRGLQAQPKKNVHTPSPLTHHARTLAAPTQPPPRNEYRVVSRAYPLWWRGGVASTPRFKV
jgi:hypothetical protein